MNRLAIERLGGLAGFGGRGGRLRSQGTVDIQSLSPADQETVRQLFEGGGPPPAPQGADAFRYRITRQTPQGPQSVEAPHEALPQALIASVRDVLD